MKIKVHNHGGYYGDGNSHYWVSDSTLDLETMMRTNIREDSYGGQLAGPSQFSHCVDIKETVTEIVSMAEDLQNKIYETLLPLVETLEKYPYLNGNFRFLSNKHKRFIIGRINKAIKLGLNEHFYATDNLHNIFILPVHDIVINVYYEDTYHHKFWTVAVQKISEN